MAVGFGVAFSKVKNLTQLLVLSHLQVPAAAQHLCYVRDVLLSQSPESLLFSQKESLGKKSMKGCVTCTGLWVPPAHSSPTEKQCKPLQSSSQSIASGDPWSLDFSTYKELPWKVRESAKDFPLGLINQENKELLFIMAVAWKSMGFTSSLLLCWDFLKEWNVTGKGREEKDGKRQVGVFIYTMGFCMVEHHICIYEDVEWLSGCEQLWYYPTHQRSNLPQTITARSSITLTNDREYHYLICCKYLTNRQ